MRDTEKLNLHRSCDSCLSLHGHGHTICEIGYEIKHTLKEDCKHTYLTKPLERCPKPTSYSYLITIQLTQKNRIDEKKAAAELIKMNNSFVVCGIVNKLDGTKLLWNPVKSKVYTTREEAEKDAHIYNAERSLDIFSDIEYNVFTVTDFINQYKGKQ